MEEEELSLYNKLNEEKTKENYIQKKTSNIDLNKTDKNKKETSTEDTKNIRLLTYNFFCRPPPVNTNKDDYKDSRLEDFVKEELPKFDIICFQELFTTLNDRKHRMIREGAKVGLKYYYSSKVPSFFSKYLCDSGLLILSKYEIVDNDSYEYYINISGDSVNIIC